MKKLFKIITNKIVVTAFFFLLQVVFTMALLLALSQISAWVYVSFSLLSLFVCLFVMGKNANPGYKLAWVIPILLVPLFGGMMYISFGRTARLRRKDRKRLALINRDSVSGYSDAHEISAECISTLPLDEHKIASLISETGNFPAYNNTEVSYYPSGEDFLKALLCDLEKAERYIFMEYFIIERGKCWNSVLEVLKRKVNEGVDVRLIYDDMGCLFTLPANYRKKLLAMGIKVHIFNKIKPTFNIRMNNRTHRKITVIDGKIAYTGGLNLADEYINEVDRYGHWKDTAIRIQGNAAQSFTIMFMQFWMLCERQLINVKEFLPELTEKPNGIKGYVQPLSSAPDGNMQVIEKGLMSMITNADRYIYLTTPYLIPDNEFITALCVAAQSGVDVKIIMPHIPDKKLVFIMSRSFYPVLLNAGVKIYEYIPGFVHAKSAVCDDSIAYVGTCNLDYRSFYLHYECGAFMYGVPQIADIKADYLKTLEKCKEITYAEATDVRAITKLTRSVLRLFAPLL